MTTTGTFAIEDKVPWGKASDKEGTSIDGNGKSFTEHAVDFAKDHPIGTLLIAETLDNWLDEAGLILLPPVDASKNSDAWMAHLQRRHQGLIKLNKSAGHPRLAEHGVDPFVIHYTKGGYEVCSPHAVVLKGTIPDKVRSLTETKKKQLVALMQGTDYASLPAYERIIAEAIYMDINAFAEDTTTSAERITQKLDRLTSRVKQIKSAGLANLKQLPKPTSDDYLPPLEGD